MQEVIADEVARIVQNVIGVAVAHNQPLMEAGLDSLASVELRNSLNAKFGVELPATVTIDYPTILALAGYLAVNTQATQGQEDPESVASSAEYQLQVSSAPSTVMLISQLTLPQLW